MKFMPLAALLLTASVATPAFADAHSEAPAAAPAVAMSINTPIATLMANESAKAVVLKHLPGIDEHPAYEEFKGMSLVALKPWSQGVITDDIIEKITTDLAALA